MGWFDVKLVAGTIAGLLVGSPASAGFNLTCLDWDQKAEAIQTFA